ncbi:MAG: UvrB/UvrC motif-containing protein [Clostridia bacterium]|nr:UvrB/UvrC motif-containing protein [Clostridia bacterium]
MFNFGGNSNFMFDTEEEHERFCENCNTSLTDILNSGEVGCYNCYMTFREEIRNYLIQKQGSFNHIGKVATKRFSKQKIENKIKDLEKQKQDAVDAENFIAAEALKNQIEKLRSSI